MNTKNSSYGSRRRWSPVAGGLAVVVVALAAWGGALLASVALGAEAHFISNRLAATQQVSAQNATRLSSLADQLARAQAALEQKNKQLEQAEQGLRKANEELEQRVRERIADLQKANDALRESEERYRTLVETIPHGIEDIDTTGIITFANSALHKMHEFDEGELIGTSILDLVATDSERKELGDYLVLFSPPAEWRQVVPGAHQRWLAPVSELLIRRP